MTCPISSTDWRTVKAWAEEELRLCRSRLEADETEVRTAQLRGRILQLRRLIEWGEPPAQPVITAASGY